MSVKPNFFIVGAPKCGTTSLTEYLRTHPDVFFSRIKEPDHFNAEGGRSDSDYLDRHFSGAGRQKAIGEGSTHYLSSDAAIPRIVAFNPEAKFIAMLRDPVDMAVSLYCEEKSQLVEDAPSFSCAWERHERTPVPALQYGRLCSMGRQLARLYESVPDPSRVHVIDFRRLVREPARVYAEVLQFLELPHDGRSAFPRFNAARRPRSGRVEGTIRAINASNLRILSAKAKAALGIESWPLLGPALDGVRRWNLVSGVPEPIGPALRATLRAYFREDLKLLKALTGIDFHE